MLTLAVFKSGKNGMRFDLGVIALLQTCAFVYGMSVVVRARPAFIVGAIDRFSVVSADGLDGADLAKGRPPFNRMPWTGPILVGSEMPSDAQERSDLAISGLAGKDLEAMPRYYVDYSNVAQSLAQRAKPLTALQKSTPESAVELTGWLRAHDRTADTVVWLPIVSKNDTTMLLDRDTGEPLDAVAVNPW